MFCENLHFNLSLYSDDVLNAEERVVLDEHLAQCPLCRQKLAHFQSLRNNLRVLPHPDFSNELLNKVRKSVAEELYTVETKPIFIFSDNVQNWLQMRLMPYTVGTVASLILGFSLLWTLLSGFPKSWQNGEFPADNPNNKSTILLANASPKGNSGDVVAIDEFPELDIKISNAAPSINPSGALIALTKSFVRGDMKDDEVVIVADVFGNGLARIAEVVEPTNNWKTVSELEDALENDPDFAPFVPAKVDHRSETVRVIFKIQHVEVSTKKARRY